MNVQPCQARLAAVYDRGQTLVAAPWVDQGLVRFTGCCGRRLPTGRYYVLSFQARVLEPGCVVSHFSVARALLSRCTSSRRRPNIPASRLGRFTAALRGFGHDIRRKMDKEWDKESDRNRTCSTVRTARFLHHPQQYPNAHLDLKHTMTLRR